MNSSIANVAPHIDAERVSAPRFKRDIGDMIELVRKDIPYSVVNNLDSVLAWLKIDITNRFSGKDAIHRR
jgi:hypothetical protein